MTDPRPSALPSTALAGYLAVVQFFFVTTWTLYVIFLPTMVEAAGVSRQYVIWILMLDQVVFAVADFFLGQAADRVAAAYGRVGPAIVAGAVVSGVAFVAMPHVASFLAPGAGAAGVSLILVVVWVATSSALRAPPWLLLSRYAATPAMPRLAALNLTGLALGGAVAPYLGVALKGMDPRLPFVVSTLVLLATTAGLVVAERRAGPPGDAVAIRDVLAQRVSGDRASAWFFGGCALLALGAQLLAFINAAPQYLRFAQPADLPYLLPLFWASFTVAMYPAASLATRFGALPVMAMAAGSAVLGAIVAAVAATLDWLIAGQLLSGGAWGAIMVASSTAAARFGHTGREGSMFGVLWCVLSIATLLRMGATAAGVADPVRYDALLWLPPVLFGIGGIVVWSIVHRVPDPAASGR